MISNWFYLQLLKNIQPYIWILYINQNKSFILNISLNVSIYGMFKVLKLCTEKMYMHLEN